MQVSFLILSLCMFACVVRADPPCVNETNTPCPRCTYSTQEALDECYVKHALAFAMVFGAARPFGAVVVDTYTNTIKCYDRNSPASFLAHAERQAMDNCTALYPSPTGNDRLNPGLFWRNMTLYTTAESCAACAAQSVFRGAGRVVHGTTIPTLMKAGYAQIDIRASDIYRAAKQFLNSAISNGYLPKLGHAAEAECDAAFYAGAGRVRISSPFDGTVEDVLAEHPPSCSCDDHGHGNH